MMERERARKTFHNMGQALDSDGTGSHNTEHCASKEEIEAQKEARRSVRNMYVTRAESAVKLVVQERKRREESEKRMKASLHTWVGDHSLSDGRKGLGDARQGNQKENQSLNSSDIASESPSRPERVKAARSPSRSPSKSPNRSRSPSPARKDALEARSNLTLKTKHMPPREPKALGGQISKIIALRKKRTGEDSSLPCLEDGMVMTGTVKDEVNAIIFNARAH